MLRFLLIPILLLAACGGGANEDGETAAEALERVLTYASQGQFTRDYASVHPSQQAFIPEETYIRCNRANPFEMTSFRHVETFTDTITIPGTIERANVSAVTAELTVDGATFTDTLYMADVDGEWRIVLRDPDFSNC